MSNVGVNRRALYALARHDPSRPDGVYPGTWGHAHEAELMAWATSLSDADLLRMRNVGHVTLAWIRGQGKVTDPLDLAELRRLAEAATPGPWRVDDAPDGSGLLVIHNPDHVAGIVGFGLTGTLNEKGDAAYIAAANPATILALLDEITTKRVRLPLRRSTASRSW